MPISFIFLGVFFLLTIFGFINLKSELFKIFLIAYLFIFLCGYYVGNININDYYFNIIQSGLVIIFYIYLFINSSQRLQILSLSILFNILYYVFISEVLVHHIPDFNILFMIILFITLVLYFKNLNNSLLLSFPLLCGVNISNCIIEHREFTFATLDFNVIFDYLIILMLLIFIYKILDNYLSKIKLVRGYEKNFNANCVNASIIKFNFF